MKSFDLARGIWQRGIERFNFIGAAPFIGGIALADTVLKPDLNELLKFGLEIGAGVAAHRKFHNLMGTELVIHPAEDGLGMLEWRIKPAMPQNQTSPLEV